MSNKEEKDRNKNNIPYDHHIVGIGASAGGLEAILELFDNIPREIACSYIIVQHLSPDYKSMMPELLEKHTKMQISEAVDGMLAKPGCIYVIPHKKNMTFRYGKLKLTDKGITKAPNTAIDIFLTSLAEDKKEKAIGIILSGTGTDGTKGLQEIKKYNGLTIVQEPLTAKFDGMPNSAINAGLADYVLPPEMMQEEIIHYLQDGHTKYNSHQGSNEDDRIITDILTMLKVKMNQDFCAYKRPTITRRIHKRMAFFDIPTLKAYQEFLNEKPEEPKLLCKDFLIGVTKFFRDEKAFEKIAREIIPEIFKNKPQEQEIKFWVAACSTGEEAFSLAILVQEYMEKVNKVFDVKIFATDVDKDAIESAAKGCYNSQILKDISEERINKYFEIAGENKYKVLPIIRRMVVFAQHDLVKNAPYSKIDLISCRNALIYLNSSLQKSIFSKFHFSIKEDGYLFLGPSENLGDFESVFLEVDKKWKIYKNNSTGKKTMLEGFSSLGTVNSFILEGRTQQRSVSASSVVNSSTSYLNDILLKESNFSAIYINENFELVHASGDYHNYLEMPKKNFDLNILKMMPEEMAISVGLAVRKVAKSNEKVSFSGLKIKRKKFTYNLDLIVVPGGEKKEAKKYFWLLLRDTNKVATIKKNIPISNDDISANERISDIELELKDTKERLQTAIEELETSNEEMQSSNEELVSANEELQSTNEELQSLNEELHTVNSEHQLKIKELIELNDDLNNYFRSTDIGQVFIDKNQAIRKYTSSIVEQINLIGSDIGRPIIHISNNINYDGLSKDIHQIVIGKESTLEREICAKNSKWYLMKIMPYIKIDKSIDGAIISFVEITQFKNLNNMLSGVLNTSLNGIIALQVIRNKSNNIIDFKCLLANEACEKILKKTGTTVGAFVSSEIPEVTAGELFDKFVNVVKTGNMLHEEHYHKMLNCWLEIVAVKMDDGLTVTFADITEKKNNEEKIRVAYEEVKQAQNNLVNLNNELEQRVIERTKELSISEERFKTLSLATNDAIWDWDFVTNKVWWNEGFKKLFGYKENQIEPTVEFWFSKIHIDDKARVVHGINSAIENGKKLWTDEYRLKKADDTYATILDRAYVMQHKDGTPYRMLGSMVDLTNLKKVQTELENTNQNLLKINADLDTFIYTASHDLKAPISNIEGLMYTLQESLETEDDDIKNILGMVSTSIDKFKETIGALTEVAKIQKEHVEDQEIINIQSLVEEVKFSIKDIFIASNAEIKYDLKQKNVKYSRKNMRSIIYNLLSNAIKYKSLEKDPVIEIATRKVDKQTILCFTDNGLGIAKSKHAHIFGMFKRFHTHVEGTGIGLYIVKRMIENVGGRIEVDSDTGKGTTFRIYIKD
ncbi:MAG: PAS domain-containing protein [Opitutaceae bacterium]|nr:PAS domain-containing protein [Cytophagales bacterium]